MDIDDFPFNDLIKELLDNKGEEGKIKISILIGEVMAYVGEDKENKNKVVGILNAYVGLGYVKENIMNLQYHSHSLSRDYITWMDDGEKNVIILN